jgi:hypothetical protein
VVVLCVIFGQILNFRPGKQTVFSPLFLIIMSHQATVNYDIYHHANYPYYEWLPETRIYYAQDDGCQNCARYAKRERVIKKTCQNNGLGGNAFAS